MFHISSEEQKLIDACLEKIEINLSKEELTPRDRIAKAERHEEPDRVPVWLCSLEHNAYVAGYTISEVLKDPKKAAISGLVTLGEYGCDTVAAYAEPHVIGTEFLGVEIEYPTHSSPILRNFPLQDDISKFKNLKIPDPYKDGNIPLVLESIAFLHEIIGKKIPIWQNTNGPFAYAGEIRGYDNLLMDLMTNTKFVHELMNFAAEVSYIVNKAISDCGAVPFIFDAMGQPSIIGVSSYEEFVLPYEKEIISRIDSSVYLGGGSVTEVLEQNADTGATGIMLSARAELDTAKKLIGDRVTLVIAEIVTDALKNGNPQEIDEIAKRDIQACAKDGGFVLAAGIVPYETPRKTCLAVIEAAKKYGMYSEK